MNAFKERSDAEALAVKLEDKGLPASYVYSCDWENLNKDPYYCVTIGRSGSESEAQGYLEGAKQAGYPKAYIKYTGEKLGHRVNYTVFDKSCDMQYFPYYQNGDSPLEWFNHIKDIKDTEEYQAQGGALMGVFEVDMTGDHVDRFYGSYWWD